MSIFGYQTRTETEISVPAYEGHVEPTLAGLQSIITESARDAFQLQAGMYISDVMMEESVLEGASPEILLEGLVKDSWTKISDAFKKLWAKVKAWFGKVKRQLELLFSSGENFIKKFEGELRTKSTKGFSYTGHHYTIGRGMGKLEKHVGDINKHIESTVKFNTTEADMTADHQVSSIKSEGTKDSYNLEDAKKALLKSLGSEEQSKVVEALQKEFRNGVDEKKEITDFSANSKEEMVSAVKESKEKLKALADWQKAIDTNFQRVLSSIETAKKRISGEKAEGEASASKARATAYASHKYEVARFALTLETTLIGVGTAALRESVSAFESTLKSFLRFKPAKEGFEFDGGSTETGSVLESAMRFL